MLSIRNALFGMASPLSAEDAPPPTFGHPKPAAERLSEMSAALPDEDNKWKLTNIGGIGSEEDKDIREKAAESEAAFEGAGQEPGIEIWRIEKFEPCKQDLRSDNLQLYSGDCYIILRTIQLEDSDALDWKLHYWIGKDSTQDESGSAAYFTVNIDDLLDQKPVQYREMQYSESALFHSYFKSVTYLDGGADSGFSKAEPDSYSPRLLQMAKIGGTVRVLQVPLSSASLNDGDVFILDAGMQIYQFNGTESNVFERRRAMEIVNVDLREPRDLEPELTILDGDQVFTCEPFWDLLGGKLDELPAADDSAELRADIGDEAATIDEVDFSAPKTLCRISKDDGEDLVMELVKQDEALSADDVDDQDVWAVACDGHAYIYVGEASSKDEKLYVWNSCDAIVLALGLDETAPIMFVSKSSDGATWEQLFE